ncbi:class I SAM-dependent methyltransferase [Alsobacter soli]|uniref:class I SAM-dependent methyltransferase n=1 Tax=Alsobacter soli TaxID=2109933 RepID=UPI001FDF64EB|nr:class I SAM-dependent methyltransferase [Alsobacter soli]
MPGLPFRFAEESWVSLMDVAVDLQQSFWNRWNAESRERSRGDISLRQAEVVRSWLDRIGRRDLTILEVGCGAGWFCEELSRYGATTGTDLSDEVLARQARRLPHVRFVPGDFMRLDFEPQHYHVIVCLEVLSHVADQAAFMEKIASLLRPGGQLLMATQNKPVLRDHCANIAPPAPGQLRKWVDAQELAELASPHFVVEELFSVSPVAHKWPRRLLTSYKVNHLLRPVLGDALRDFMEARGWGWTLMLRARRPELDAAARPG